MIDLISQVAGAALAFAIFWRAEAVLNIMAGDCRFVVRVAFWLLAGGAAGVGVAIWQGYVPPGAVLLSLAGIALLLITERRIGALLRLHRPVTHERRSRP